MAGVMMIGVLESNLTFFVAKYPPLIASSLLVAV